MRIRTIKPEFWTHPVLARKSDTVKLLAVGLLNYADDEGYFLADPLLVRGALRAFDESSSITRGALDELSRIGYVEVSTHDTHGSVGRVVSFLAHQRIDRPNPSKLAHLFNSTSVRRVLVANASTEQGREQGREQGTGNGKEQNVAVAPVVQKFQKPTEAPTPEMLAPCLHGVVTVIAPCMTPSPSPSPSPSTNVAVAPVVQKKFQKPTEADVSLQASKIGIPEAEAVKFWNFYESKGWLVGKSPMRSWQAAMITWRGNWQERQGSSPQLQTNGQPKTKKQLEWEMLQECIR